jgi:cell division protein FtsL
MATWSAAARADRAPAPRPRARIAKKSHPQRRVAGGVVWIAVVAALLAGVVALNVAVLRLNMQVDRLGRERAGLRAENAALSSQLSQAAATGRIQRLAMKRLGFTLATPEQTSFVPLHR